MTVTDGRFMVDHDKIPGAVEALTTELLTIEAEGNYARAEMLLETMGVVRPEVQRVLDRLESVPIDIQPRYTTADELHEGR